MWTVRVNLCNTSFKFKHIIHDVLNQTLLISYGYPDSSLNFYLLYITLKHVSLSNNTKELSCPLYFDDDYYFFNILCRWMQHYHDYFILYMLIYCHQMFFRFPFFRIYLCLIKDLCTVCFLFSLFLLFVVIDTFITFRNGKNLNLLSCVFRK